MQDKRNAERKDFQGGVRVTMAAIDGTWRLDCTLREISVSGARLQVMWIAQAQSGVPWAPARFHTADADSPKLQVLVERLIAIVDRFFSGSAGRPWRRCITT